MNRTAQNVYVLTGQWNKYPPTHHCIKNRKNKKKLQTKVVKNNSKKKTKKKKLEVEIS